MRRKFPPVGAFALMVTFSSSLSAGVYLIEPSSFLDFSGTIAGVPWTSQDAGGESFQSRVGGEIVGERFGDEFDTGAGSFLELFGLWAGAAFPGSPGVPGASGTQYNYAGRVDLGPGGVIESTTYDLLFDLFSGTMSTLEAGSDLQMVIRTGISNYAVAGSSGASSTSLASGVPNSVSNGALVVTPIAGGERISFDLDIHFQGVTELGGGLVPFTLDYTGRVNALQGVPEPSALMLLGVAGCLAGWRRKR